MSSVIVFYAMFLLKRTIYHIILKYLNAYSIPSSNKFLVTNEDSCFSFSGLSPTAILFGTASSIGISFILSPMA